MSSYKEALLRNKKNNNKIYVFNNKCTIRKRENVSVYPNIYKYKNKFDYKMINKTLIKYKNQTDNAYGFYKKRRNFLNKINFTDYLINKKSYNYKDFMVNGKINIKKFMTNSKGKYVIIFNTHGVTTQDPNYNYSKRKYTYKMYTLANFDTVNTSYLYNSGFFDKYCYNLIPKKYKKTLQYYYDTYTEDYNIENYNIVGDDNLFLYNELSKKDKTDILWGMFIIPNLYKNKKLSKIISSIYDLDSYKNTNFIKHMHITYKDMRKFFEYVKRKDIIYYDLYNRFESEEKCKNIVRCESIGDMFISNPNITFINASCTNYIDIYNDNEDDEYKEYNNNNI